MKKAQTSMFIILGMIVFLTIILAYFITSIYTEETFRPEIYEGVDLDSKFESLNNYINFCLKNAIDPVEKEQSPIRNIARQGGKFKLNNKIMYDTVDINVLCQQKENQGCITTPLLKKDIEKDLNLNFNLLFKRCLELDEFTKKGYNLEYDKSSINIISEISKDDITVKVDFPVKIFGDEATKSTSTFFYKYKSPLGRLYDLAVDITNEEIQYQSFNKDDWMIRNDAFIRIEKHNPYPNQVFRLTKDGLIFQFAIKGIDTIGKPYPDQNPTFGSCIIDSVCFANTPENICKGVYSTTNCAPISNYTLKSSAKDDCAGKKHGESWCSYDSIVGRGYDYVGSRHYKQSCIDGEIIQEECRDYREELCTETKEQDITKAVCRKNRWQDCHLCDDKNCCLDSLKRDCFWKDFLQTERKCVPEVPPGFKFWEGNGKDVCSASNSKTEFTGLVIHNEWIDGTAILCLSQGDCGNYRNIADEVTKVGFRNSDGKEKEYIYNENGLHREGRNHVVRLPLNTFYQETLISTFQPPSNYPTAEEIAIALKKLESYKPKPLDKFRKDKIIRPAISRCELWQPPTTDFDCHKCEDKVCTEYRCKSLGQNCQFTSLKGIPKCFKPGDGDLTSPLIQADEASLPEKYTYEKATLGSDKKVWYHGYAIKQLIQPHDSITFGIKTIDPKKQTPEPTRCKITYLPESDFISLPPIWFGNYDYKSQHNITIRLPSKVDIPENLFDTLNISSINNLIDLPGFIQDKSKLAPIKILDEFKQGRYYLFIKCNDESGNENKDEFFIKFELNSTNKDNTPPQIVFTQPRNEESLPSQSSVVPLELYLNEPSSCKASLSDTDYDNMDFFFNCVTSEYELSDKEGGTYLCEKELPYADTYYISCKDNPPPTGEFYLTLRESTEFSMNTSEEGINLSDETISVDDISSLDGNIKINVNTNPILKFNISMQAKCRYSTEQIPFDLMKDFPCTNITCKERLILRGKETEFIIKCQQAGNATRNVNTQRHVINLKKSTGFKLKSVLPSGEVNTISPNLVVEVHDNTTKTRCSYTTQTNYYSMSLVNNQFIKRLSNLENFKEYDYKIKCTDEIGNIAESSTVFSVVI